MGAATTATVTATLAMMIPIVGAFLNQRLVARPVIPAMALPGRTAGKGRRVERAQGMPLPPFLGDMIGDDNEDGDEDDGYPRSRVRRPKAGGLWLLRRYGRGRPTDEEEIAAREGWLRWMKGGKPVDRPDQKDGGYRPRKRGVGDVKMREAAELGGLPRSDRYSSRSVFIDVGIPILIL